MSRDAPLANALGSSARRLELDGRHYHQGRLRAECGARDQVFAQRPWAWREHLAYSLGGGGLCDLRTLAR